MIPDASLAEYTGLREAHHSDRTRVLHAHRRSDGTPVVLKMLAPGCGDPGVTRSLRWEYELLQVVRGEGVVGATRLIASPSGPILELEDLGGVTLATLPPLGVEPVIHVGIQLAGVLTRIHRLGVLHRDIHPKNIAFSADKGHVTLLDFDASARMEGRVLRSAEAGPGGAFGYWAPEQTGRIGVPVDARTDLFSLGAVLYRLLTGVAPGATDDALGAVHAALAVVPAAAHTVRPDVPPTLSRIVARLLAKVPEDRYQSAAGLMFDLTHARDDLRLTGRVSDFGLGARDVSEVFSPSRRLYGRAEALATLDRAFTTAAEGGPVLTITGPPGVGKSALVAEAARQLAAGGGSIAEGRYDQTSPSPMSGVVEALHAAIRAALTLPERELVAVRARVTDAVEESGPAFLELVPKLKLLVPSLPPVPELPPAEARNRTLAGLDALVRALHTPSRRLVVFLDDLQWADPPSVELLERLLLTPAGRPTLLLAWRDAEVGPDHPLTAIFARLPPDAVQALRLGPLGITEVTELVADTLSCPRARAIELAAPLAAKSAGSPYFVLQLLESLHERGGLRFDAEHRGWTWSEADLARIEMADNLAVLLAERLGGLPSATRKVVAIAARLGYRVMVPLLAAALGAPAGAALAALEPVLIAGHLVLSAEADAVSFAHHRVRQAALAGRDGVDIDHPAVARRLASASEDFDAFVVADRCIEAMGHPVARADALPFARALTRAARSARLAGATAAALGYAEHGARALATTEDPDLWVELYTEGARASVICTDRVPKPDFIAVLMDRATDRPTRIRAVALKIERHLARWENDAALDGTIDALADLGVYLPRNPTMAHVLLGLMKTAFTLWRVGDERLAQLPVATDPNVLAAQDLLLRSITAAYYSRPNLLSLLIITSIDLAVASGIGPPTGWAFSAYAFIQAVVLGRLDRGLYFARLARATLKRTDANYLATRVELTVIGFIESREGRLAEIGERYETLLPQAIADGDWEYAALCANNVVLFGLGGSVPLDELLTKAERMVATCVGLGHRRQVVSAQLFAQVVDALRGGAGEPGEVSGRFMSGGELTRLTAEESDPNLISSWHAGRTMVNVHLGDFERAASAAGDMEPFLAAHPGAPQAYWHHMCGGVARALTAKGTSGAAKSALLSAAKRSRKALLAWVAASPHNHEHRLSLVDGALASTAGNTQEALGHFEAAARLALQGEFIADAALAMQLAARTLREVGLNRAASGYLAEAITLYGRWGAKPVVARLRSLGGRPEAAAAPSASARGFLAPEHVALLRAARAISEVTGLNPLLETVLSVLVEAVGARRGLLAVPAKGKLVAVAHASSTDGQVAVKVLAADLAVNPDDLVPGSVATLDYVVRTGEPVKVDEPRSLLAVPLRKGDTLLGVVYLDNDALPGAFGAWHQELASVLAAQAAIALQNAGLVEDLRSSLEMQTRIAQSYNRFVPHELIALLERNGILEVLPGDQVMTEFTVLFADVRGFTAIAEQLPPALTFYFINEYLRHVQPAVDQNGGIINQFLGDGIMALFPKDADAAVAGAVAMFAGVRAYNAGREATLPEIRIGVGMNTGMLALGTRGVPERLDCGVVGDPVNIASRVEGLTKPYGAPLVISETTYLAMKHPARFAIRELDLVVPVGRKQPLRIYEVIDAEVGAMRDGKLATLERFRAARTALSAGRFEEALSGFSACVTAFPADSAASLLVQRCAQLREDGSAGWDGAYRPKVK